MAVSRKKNFWLFTASAVAALVATDYAYAQDSGDGEIVVTATRREARLQDVPIAVTPVTAEMIENSGIRDLQDLTSVAPGLVFTNAASETSATARLRGIGTEGSNPGLESAVGIFVDGVYRARNGVALTDIGEISQVEVLRGPQGTLFGRNTSAGLITVRTAGPDLSGFGGSAEATLGNYGEQRFSGTVTGPIVEDQLGFRLFAATGQRDGYFDVVNAAGQTRDVNNRDVWTVRGQLLWEPTPDLSLRLIADYSERDEECCAARNYNPRLLNGTGAALPQATNTIINSLGGYGPGGLAALGSGEISNGARIGFANRPYDQIIEDQGVSGELNWDLGGMTLTSVTAWRDWSYLQGQDADFTAADIIYRDSSTGDGFGFEIFTQEFRLSGVNGKLDWLVGAFYADESLDRVDFFSLGSQYQDYMRAQVIGAVSSVPLGAGTVGSANAAAIVAPLAASLASAEGGGVRDRYAQTNESIALFTHNIFSVTDDFEITLGLRYTQEEKSLRSTYLTTFNGAPLLASTGAGIASGLITLGVNPAVVTGSGIASTGAFLLYGFPWLTGSNDVTANQSREENEWSGIISARYSFTDDVSAYVSYSQGYKAGGFNLDRDTAPPVDTSFAAETVDAYEVGLKTSLMNGDLLLNTAVYYQEFSNFQLNTFTGVQFIVASVPEVLSSGAEVDVIWRTPVDGLSFQGGASYTEAEYGNFPAVGGIPTRLPNAQLTNSPMWTATGSFTYERPLGDNLMGLAYIDARYQSDVNSGSDLDVEKRQPSYTLVNARLGVSTMDERWTLELWGRNILDEEFTVINFDTPLQLITPTYSSFLGDPRTYGVTLRTRF
jgi:outer membrane receptor protein involved in Fe transport